MIKTPSISSIKKDEPLECDVDQILSFYRIISRSKSKGHRFIPFSSVLAEEKLAQIIHDIMIQPQFKQNYSTLVEILNDLSSHSLNYGNSEIQKIFQNFETLFKSISGNNNEFGASRKLVYFGRIFLASPRNEFKINNDDEAIQSAKLSEISDNSYNNLISKHDEKQPDSVRRQKVLKKIYKHPIAYPKEVLSARISRKYLYHKDENKPN